MKPLVMITCGRCQRELPKIDSCSLRVGRNYSRVCQDCIRLMMGLKPRRASYTPPAVVETRKVSFDDVKREFEEAKEEES